MHSGQYAYALNDPPIGRTLPIMLTYGLAHRSRRYGLRLHL